MRWRDMYGSGEGMVRMLVNDVCIEDFTCSRLSFL